MESVLLTCPREDAPFVVAELSERGTAGVHECDLPDGRVELRAFFEEGGAAVHAAARFAMYHPVRRIEPPQDWAAVSMAAFPPLSIGRRFFVAPEWSEEPTPEGRLRIVVLPGRACGTGAHETTQLCLEAMEECLNPADTILDLGVGSGILSEAARLLGARRILACDIDPESVEIARRRLVCDILVYVGSARSIRSGVVDLLVANINAETITQLAPELARVTKAGGRAILSGFPPHHLERVLSSTGPSEWGGARVYERNHWSAVIVTRMG